MVGKRTLIRVMVVVLDIPMEQVRHVVLDSDRLPLITGEPCYIEFIKRVRKRDKMRACRAFYLFFRNEFNKFTKTRARKLDSIKN